MDTALSLPLLTGELSGPTLCLLLALASFRIWLEIVGFDFLKLPLTKKLSQLRGQESWLRFHKMGFYFSVGFLILFAPQVLLA